jgi:glucose-1-phosphate thymidylyltransferase
LKSSKILIRENLSSLELKAPHRIFSFSEIRDGLFTPLERLKIKNSNSVLHYQNQDPIFQSAFLNRNEKVKPYNQDDDVDLVFENKDCMPWDLISNLSSKINDDIELYVEKMKWINKFKINSKSFKVVGKTKNLYIHQETNIYPNVVFDVNSGPIVIDKNVKISPFSYLEGPLFIGSGTHIDNARITGGCIIGTNCRIGGEVENSIVNDFSNKHHEGFLGHSYVGQWVNIGALSTTSDLKNNYGVVKLTQNESQISTGTIKFGSIISDFVKIGIGTMINTGTIIETGCNIVQNRISGYIKPFTWADGVSRYRLDKFISDTKKIMARRNQNLSPFMEEVIKNIYEQ